MQKLHIYFSGIGGTGLSPLANLALDCGYLVSGSDREDSQNIADLVDRDVQITIGQSLEEISAIHVQNPIDWIVATSALPEDHPHKTFAAQNNIKISKRHELINLILEEKDLKLLAVAGTHGKTTTVGMMIWMMKQMKIPMSYLIGTNISYGISGEYAKGSEYFVYECDEFDRNFLNFEPYLSIIPSLDYDHPDTYKTEIDYSEAFLQFIAQSQNTISWEVVSQYMGQVFGDNGKGMLKKLEGKEVFFIPDKEPNNLAYYANNQYIKIPGVLIRRNALVAMSGLQLFCGLDMDEMLKAVATFPGTQRRFEKLAPNLYSDYGHHPAEIFATLQKAGEILNEEYESKVSTFEGKLLEKAGELQQQKLILVYQPHQNIRQHDPEIQNGYRHCFVSVDKVYWLPTYLSREYTDLPVLSPQGILDKSDLTSNLKFQVADFDQDLVDAIKSHLSAGDMVIVMGAGDIDGWAREKLA